MSSRVGITALLLLAGCAELEPGVTARLELSSDLPGLQLELSEAALIACPEAGGVASWLWSVAGPGTAWAHGEAPGEGADESLFAGPASLELSEQPSRLDGAPVGPGPWCGVRLRFEGPSPTRPAASLDERRQLAPFELKPSLTPLEALHAGEFRIHVRWYADRFQLAEQEGLVGPLRAAAFASARMLSEDALE